MVKGSVDSVAMTDVRGLVRHRHRHAVPDQIPARKLMCTGSSKLAES